jgi:hypothetical protein
MKEQAKLKVKVKVKLKVKVLKYILWALAAL